MSVTRRVARNFGWLLSGRGAGALLALAATALMARNLGPEPFGLVILLHTAAHILRHLCSVKSSEAAIRFGQHLLDRKDDRNQPTAAWLDLIGALFRFDLLIALSAATLAAAGLVFAAEPMGLPADMADAAWIYVAAMICTATGAAKGALRGLDRYRLLSVQLMAAPALRLAGVAACIGFAAPIEWYVTVWGASLLLEHALLLTSAAPYLRLPKLGTPIRPALATQPKLAPFLKAVYWQSNLDMVPRHGATLAVGLLFGAHSAGIYRLARDIAEVVSKPVILLRQAIFPDLTELWSQNKSAFLSLTWGASAVLALAGRGLCPSCSGVWRRPAGAAGRRALPGRSNAAGAAARSGRLGTGGRSLAPGELRHGRRGSSAHSAKHGGGPVFRRPVRNEAPDRS